MNKEEVSDVPKMAQTPSDEDEAEDEENKDTEEIDGLALAQKENRWVFWLRVLTAFVLLAVTISICLVVYFQGRQAERDDFEQDFADLADKLVSSFAANFNDRIGVVENFSQGVTAEAANKGGNGTDWPFVTPRDWTHRANGVGRLAHLMMMFLVPIVPESIRTQWEEYAVANQGWKAEALSIKTGMPAEEVNASPIFPVIMNAHWGGPPKVEDSPGPYWPLWTSWPPANSTPNNINLYANKENVDGLDLASAAGITTFVRSFDYWDVDPEKVKNDPRYITFKTGEYLDYLDDPFCLAFVPVFDKNGGIDQEVVAVFMIVIYWRTYFDGRLPPGSDGVFVILENTCGQHYTYKIDHGSANFVGRGDLHNAKYDYMGVGTEVDDSSLTADAMYSKYLEDGKEGTCHYSIRAYPSEDLEQRYQSSDPWVYALILAALFVFTSVIFVIYDYMVERRQRIVAKSAEQTGRLVSELYPKDVREKLYQEHEAKKHRDDDFLHSTNGVTSSKAIATLYPNCTIVFADLSGFTKWSSTRTPAEVFELLETLYGCFDKIARRRKVFKVETIGDCYVAVTGIPEPQKDHAVIMAKFAKDCLNGMRTVVNDLAERLGEDTVELELRVGLHSGPVTAGVLRGEKGRFQLFGDTVNTASRLETTGVPGRIHCSELTADALTQAGLSSWLVPREDTIIAKGKGEMKTFFIAFACAKSTKSLGSSGGKNSASGMETVSNDGTTGHCEDHFEV